MDYEIIAAIIFISFLTIFLHYRRRNLDTKPVIPNILYFSMFRTKLGLKAMESWAQKHHNLIARITGIVLLSTSMLLHIITNYENPQVLNLMLMHAVLVGSGALLLFKPSKLSHVIIFFGFLGMVLIGFELVKNLITHFTKPDAAPGVGVVLPVKGKGIFYVPFSYWIVSIFIIAVVHEFAHGLISRVYKIKVKSSGFAFVSTSFKAIGMILTIFILLSKIRNGEPFGLSAANDFWLIAGIVMLILSYSRNFLAPVIPAAFVEPDEKELKKRPHMQQLAVFGAGPFSNIILAFVFMIIAALMLTPVSEHVIEPNGVRVTGFVESKETLPAKISGISEGEVITSAGGMQTPWLDNLTYVLRSKKPGDNIEIRTDKTAYTFTLGKNPDNESMAYMGAYLEQASKIKDSFKEKYGSFIGKAIVWFSGDFSGAGLLGFLIMLNLGIGLFNLVPLGPVDGGRMIQLPLIKWFGKEKGNKAWKLISLIFLTLILLNLLSGFFNLRNWFL
jgi:membrane-associated protease RseP (regulator of RpoE activity)